MRNVPSVPYRQHLKKDKDLITTYEATRAGFVALALEKNRRASPFVAEARALQEGASLAKIPVDLLEIKSIEAALLTAAGLSDKSLVHLLPQDREDAIRGLIKKFLEPAGTKFVEELVFRFLLTRGDSLGGSMRNLGGALAQRKLTRSLISTLTIGGASYRWQHSRTKKWLDMSPDDSDIELFLRGLSWENQFGVRTLVYNLTVPIVRNNVDLSLFKVHPNALDKEGVNDPNSYIAIGELKGGIDPAGADEHWKTARAALDRIRDAFSKTKTFPKIFFIAAAVEKKMAEEIWNQLRNGKLANAANLNEEKQLASISRWLCNL